MLYDGPGGIMIRILFAVTVLTWLTACSAPTSETAPATPPQDSAASTVPSDIAAVATAAAPGLTITGGELDAANNEYEVMGRLPNGDEIELDVVQSNGAWSVLEIQRDVPWSSVPEPVRAAANAERASFEPVRVIESKQPADGSIVYELFTAENQSGGNGGGLVMEVRWLDGKAEVVTR
jgi:hypothetical protein